MDIFTYLEAVLLGVVEGLTEFIPVSSTGHLILLVDLLGFNGPPGKVFEIVIQLGAILAICWLYREKLFSIALRLPFAQDARRFTLNILLAFLPSVVLGVLLHDIIKTVLFSPYVVCTSLITGGIIMLWAERREHKETYEEVEQLSFKTALGIGLIQTLAMIPGTSRSGATIIGGLFLGLSRRAATEFSFFLAIPTMLGATVYDVYKNRDVLSLENTGLIAVGFITAFIAALLVVRSLVKFVSSHGFAPFAYYRIALGTLMLLLLWLH